MKPNIKPLTPRCGICKKLYSYREDDGSGLCPKCRPFNSHPLLEMKHQGKQATILEVGKSMMDDFDLEELKEQATVDTNIKEENEVLDIPKSQEMVENISSVDNAKDVPIMEEDNELKIEDIVQPGRYGVSNSQMIPALKKAIAEQSIKKVELLKKSYFYTYDKSIRYLKKAEREYIANNLK